MAVAAEAPTTGWKEDVLGSDWLVVISLKKVYNVCLVTVPINSIYRCMILHLSEHKKTYTRKTCQTILNIIKSEKFPSIFVSLHQTPLPRRNA